MARRLSSTRKRRPGVQRVLQAAVFALGCAGMSGSALASAFPGAVGYGARAEGWRGGEVMAVTNLQNAGPGSLRACAEALVPRVCVFKVAGTITLTAPIMVRSNVYIAGQTAPGGGIQIRIAGSSHGPIIIKNSTDVVARFLKIRPGPGPNPNLVDAVTVEDSQRVYLGNLSMAFAMDETFNIHVSSGVVRDITLADSILAYSLDKAGHPDGNHSKGALICSAQGTGNVCGQISLIRNLFAHNRDRNPDLKSTGLGTVEFLGNVIYNPISQFGEFYTFLGDLRVPYHGNVAITGPSTTSRANAAVEGIVDPATGRLFVQMYDNIARTGKDCPRSTPLPVLDQVANQNRVNDLPVTMNPVKATRAVATVTARAGDNPAGAPHRDALDMRVLQDLAECKGRIINSPDDVGGWPQIAPTAAPQDIDSDMLPDAWEAKRAGLSPNQPNNPWTLVNGMPAIELWMAEMAGDPVPKKGD